MAFLLWARVGLLAALASVTGLLVWAAGRTRLMSPPGCTSVRRGATDVGASARRTRIDFTSTIAVFVVVDGVGDMWRHTADIAIASMRERLSRQMDGSDGSAKASRSPTTKSSPASTRPDWHGLRADGGGRRGRSVVVGTSATRDSINCRTRIEKIAGPLAGGRRRRQRADRARGDAASAAQRGIATRARNRTTSAIRLAFLPRSTSPPERLLICSDGLSDLVPSETIRRIAASRAGSPESVVRELIEAANNEGGKDNITAIFIERPMFRAGAISAARAARRADGRWRRKWVFAAAVFAPVVAGLFAGLSFDARPLSGDRLGLGWPAGAIVVIEQMIAARQCRHARHGRHRTRETGSGDFADNPVISRIPRGAILRLPGLAAEHDAAVLASGVTNAELTGFRIVGDAATPLGIGVITRDGAVRLVDLEVSGASVSALDVGGGTTALIGSQIHDNPGSALLLRTGATPRLTQNVFERNASSEQAPAAFVIERDARPEWSRNIFRDIGPEAIAGTDLTLRSSLLQENWFLGIGSSGHRDIGSSGRRPPE
jgi:hypothetical protein